MDFEKENLYTRIYNEVKKIPKGKVSTYGRIAAQIGLKRYARHVGFALNAVHAKHKVPWHRVVNAQGKISQRKDGPGDEIQSMALKAEGVEFLNQQAINLKIYLWIPS